MDVEVGVGVGDTVGVGVGVGVGPGATVNKTGAELVACVPEMSLKTIIPGHVPAGTPFTVSTQLPLEDRTALCTGVSGICALLSTTSPTVPVTTGVPVERVTSTLKITGLLDVVALTEFTVKVLGSWIGIKSATSGVHVPFVRSRNELGVPRKTLRSTRVPGTPYFFAMPHEVYCQTIHRDEQFEVVHE